MPETNARSDRQKANPVSRSVRWLYRIMFVGNRKKVPPVDRKNYFSTIVMGLMLLAAAVLIGNMANLMLVRHEELSAEANSRQFITISIPAERGSIYDSNGTILAQSATVYRIFLDPGLFRTEMELVEERNQSELQAAAEAAQKGEVYQADIVNTAELKETLAQYLATTLSVDAQTVRDAFEKESNYVILQKQVEKSKADRILEYISAIKMPNSQRTITLTSISRESDTKRFYPQNELAASVIGFNNVDGEGLYGIEAYYNEYLSGIDGKTVTAKDADGDEMPYRYSKTYEAQNGDDVYLTIDITLQTYLENAITEMVDTFEVGNRACGVILNAKTGAVLAMATVPGFDLNDPFVIYDADTQAEIDAIIDETERSSALSAAREKQWRNKCITETYIPGSVFKVITASGALEENVVTYGDHFHCTGQVDISGVPFHCWKLSGHGSETFEKILTNSCNPAFIDIGQRMGKDLFFRYFEAFGLTQKTGIDLPGETSSVYQRLDTMGPVELASSSFGQTNSLSPIEVVTAYAAAVNGGYLLEPYVVSKIVDNDGNVVLTNEKTVRRQVISGETSEEMRSALQAVVENNGGSNAYIKGYKIGGKSGTSQIISGNYNEDDMQYVASYCCFAPADDPEIVMLIMADQPNTEIDYYGSSVVVPYARAVLEKSLPYLGYYPEYTDEEKENLDVTVPLLIDTALADVQLKLDALGLRYEIVGEGNTVTMQTPVTGSVVSKGSTVLLYTDNTVTEEYVAVPDVVGLSFAEANARFTEAGLNYVAKGAATDQSNVKVLLQGVAPGTMVQKWSVVTLDFGISDQSG